MHQSGAWFGLMGIGLALLIMARATFSVFALVGLLALGTALITPNLAALISKRGGSHRVGAALGVHNAANSLGQASGPLLGSALFIWQMNAPYAATGVLSVKVALQRVDCDGHAARGQTRVMNDACEAVNISKKATEPESTDFEDEP